MNCPICEMPMERMGLGSNPSGDIFTIYKCLDCKKAYKENPIAPETVNGIESVVPDVVDSMPSKPKGPSAWQRVKEKVGSLFGYGAEAVKGAAGPVARATIGAGGRKALEYVDPEGAGLYPGGPAGTQQGYQYPRPPGHGPATGGAYAPGAPGSGSDRYVKGTGTDNIEHEYRRADGAMLIRDAKGGGKWITSADPGYVPPSDPNLLTTFRVDVPGGRQGIPERAAGVAGSLMQAVPWERLPSGKIPGVVSEIASAAKAMTLVEPIATASGKALTTEGGQDLMRHVGKGVGEGMKPLLSEVGTGAREVLAPTGEGVKETLTGVREVLAPTGKGIGDVLGGVGQLVGREGVGSVLGGAGQLISPKTFLDPVAATTQQAIGGLTALAAKAMDNKKEVSLAKVSLAKLGAQQEVATTRAQTALALPNFGNWAIEAFESIQSKLTDLSKVSKGDAIRVIRDLEAIMESGKFPESGELYDKYVELYLELHKIRGY